MRKTSVCFSQRTYVISITKTPSLMTVRDTKRVCIARITNKIDKYNLWTKDGVFDAKVNGRYNQLSGLLELMNDL